MDRINVFEEKDGQRTLVGWFDVDAAKLKLRDPSCCTDGIDGRHTDEPGPHENLWHTADGRWVLNQWFNDGDGYVITEEDRFYYLTDKQVRTWLAAHHYDKEYAAHFGPMPAEVGPEIGDPVEVRLGEFLAPVRELAALNGTRPATMVRTLVREALFARGLLPET